MVVPDSLKNKLELYGRNGRIFLRPNDIFKEESWISVLQGQGVVPQDYHPLADALSSQELEQYMGHIRDNIQKALVKMPAHKEFIAKYCAAARP